MPEWRNWYTHQTQNLARFTPHESSSLSSGTKVREVENFLVAISKRPSVLVRRSAFCVLEIDSAMKCANRSDRWGCSVVRRDLRLLAPPARRRGSLFHVRVGRGG